MNGAVGDMAQAIAGRVDDAPTCVAQAGVQPQKPHAV
jgi:hypothetical protein